VSLIAAGGFALLLVVPIETGELGSGDTFPEGQREGREERGRGKKTVGGVGGFLFEGHEGLKGI